MLIGIAGDDALTKEATQTTISLVNGTNLDAATNYYPSGSGYDMVGTKDLSLLMACSGGVTVTVEAGDGTTWVDVTKAGYSLNTNLRDAASFIDKTDIVNFIDLGQRYFRVKSVTADASNSVKLLARIKTI